MKHHETRMLIDELVVTSKQYGNTQQIREQIASVLRKHLPAEFFPTDHRQSKDMQS